MGAPGRIEDLVTADKRKRFDRDVTCELVFRSAPDVCMPILRAQVFPIPLWRSISGRTTGTRAPDVRARDLILKARRDGHAGRPVAAMQKVSATETWRVLIA